ncbi:MAG: (2Fe-2S)-binding protein [Gemmatimonadetes bacterium]|nr:(2Fe-2S)-binding protein [Gemmatimonadota bacterium]
MRQGRLNPHPSHLIDQSRPIEFLFDGRTYKGFEGDTVASALWAAGVRMFSRSFKYHRPRAPFAMTSADTNCMVRADDEPNVRACVKSIASGLNVTPQNVWPSLNADLMSLSPLGARFMPAGFYYRTFMRPKFLWPWYERVLRNAAGLGYVTLETPSAYYDKEYGFSELLVIGGGPSGMSAALSAAGRGVRVVLLEESPYLGGHLRHERQTVETATGERLPAYELAARLSDRVFANPNISVELETYAFGIYEDLWIGAAKRDTRLLKIRAQSLILANGAFERPLVFENNDLPGVMLGSAAGRLLHLYATMPGRRAVVVSANDDGLRVAIDLHAAGIEVAAVVELRNDPDQTLAAALRARGIDVKARSVVVKAHGRRRVERVTIGRMTDESPSLSGTVDVTPGTREVVKCDLVTVSIGWTPATGLLHQAGGQTAYDTTAAESRVTQLPERVRAAGRVSGTHDVTTAMAEGEMHGLDAAAELGLDDGASTELREKVASLKATQLTRNSSAVHVLGGKMAFVSFDEDVTVKDINDSVAEGYSSMELLKRYSTLSMGPSQGKYESTNTMALCSAANDEPIATAGSTTSRPPFHPVSLGVLAGRKMEPVKHTPMHDWHVEHGARMMNVGLWKRPEHYGDPAEEVLTTRRGVGLIDVSTLGKLQVIGPDVPGLLEMLYINRWRKLAPGRVRYGVMCTDEGMISDDGIAANLGADQWYVTTTTGGADGVYENIEWNLQSGWTFDVHVANVTDHYAAMNLTGPRAVDTLREVTDIDLRGDALPYMSVREGHVAQVPARVMRIGFTGELGLEIHVAAGYGLHVWETLMDAGRAHGIAAFGVEAQRIMRLETGHFIVGQDTDALTDPYMANLERAVRTDKPDFLGRPSLVHIEQRGIRSKLVGYRMLDAHVVPPEGSQIVVPNSSQPIGLEIIGRITSARYSPTLKASIGLCWLPADRCGPGAEFTARVRGELLPGRVVSLPHYDPKAG